MATYQVLVSGPAVSSGDLRRMSEAPQPVKASVLAKALISARTAPGGQIPKFRAYGTEYSAADAIASAESINLEHGSVFVLKMVAGKKPAAVFFACPIAGIEIRAE